MELPRLTTTSTGPLLLAAALLLAACDRSGPASITLAGLHGEAPQWLVRFTAGDGTCLAVHRIDGGVDPKYQHAPVTADRPQYLLTTGRGPGRDQGKILVFDEAGRRLVDYKASCRLKRRDGSVFQQAQWPFNQSVRPFTYAERRLLAFTTRGQWGRSSLVVLEATQPDRLEERLVFWSTGTIHHLIVEPPRLLAVGLSNHLKAKGDQYYPVSLAVFHLDDLLDADPADAFLDSRAPRKETPGSVEGSAYRAFYRFPTDGERSPQWGPPEQVEGELIGTSGRGLRHRLHLETGRYEPEPNPDYRNAYEERRQADPDLPASLEEHMAALRKQLRVWRRAE
ncbi:MAG: hypothetical protein ACYTEZ_07645 [Planctomycetota bacterium]|jgi:hypothetical protein